MSLDFQLSLSGGVGWWHASKTHRVSMQADSMPRLVTTERLQHKHDVTKNQR